MIIRCPRSPVIPNTTSASAVVSIGCVVAVIPLRYRVTAVGEIEGGADDE
jgi:hypothetical protein